MFTKREFRDRWFLTLFATALLINVDAWIFLLVRTWGLRGEISQFALHYTIYFGVDRLGAWWQIFRGPFVGLIFFVVNFVLAGWMYSRERVWSVLIGIATVLVQILILLGSVLVVLLNV